MQPVQTNCVNILAVDDVPDNLFILESILGDVDSYHLDCVNDGQAALNYVEKQPPDLILLDVMMPEMDGYEVTRRIRNDKKLAYIPILLVTAHDQSSLTEGLDSGADDFIRKPFDIDELMARVRSLIRLKQSLDEQASMLRQRDDFVARLTHDLRTPLVAANRMLHLCTEGVFGTPPEEMEEAINSVVTNNKNLLQMTNTLLQVYRHEAGQKKLVLAPLSLYELSKEIVQELKPLADEKGVALTIQTKTAENQTNQPQAAQAHIKQSKVNQSPSTDQPTSSSQTQSASSSTSAKPELSHSKAYKTKGDILEIRRLLTNLLGNAIKFTDTGSITVELSLSSLSKESGKNIKEFIDVAITDTGAGIAPEAQEQIFEWFFQGDHMKAGSGLGLHLSKRIAELHRGNLTVKSKVGKGSTFTLSLPKVIH
ncbi:MAG: hybrid sensor histidine kinase/response regulator [Cyanobacteria bacterium J06650_10]